VVTAGSVTTLIGEQLGIAYLSEYHSTPVYSKNATAAQLQLVLRNTGRPTGLDQDDDPSVMLNLRRYRKLWGFQLLTCSERIIG